MKKSLKTNAILNSLQGLLNIVFPLITFPYVSRVLSVTGMGRYNFSYSIISYFLLIAALGISTFAVREGAKYRDNREKISEFASKVFTINLISTLFAYILLVILLMVARNLQPYKNAIYLFSLEIFLTTIGVDWVYIIFEEYAYITFRNIIFKAFSIALLFCFVRHENDYLNYVMITVFATTGSYILNFAYAKKFCDLKLNFNFDFKTYIKPILVIFASTVAIQIYVNADTTMIGLIKGNYAVGIYNISVRVYTIIASLLASILAVTIPRLSMFMGKGKKQEYNLLLQKLINGLFIIVVPAIVGLMILSKTVVALLGGSKYLASSASLKILSMAIIFKLFCSVFNDCVLIPSKKENKSLIAFTFAAILNIGLNCVLIPLFSERGAAFTTVLAELSAMIINFYYGRQIILPAIKNKKTLHNVVTVIASTSIMASVCLLIGYLIHIEVIKLTLQIVLSVFIYFTALVLMKNPLVKNAISQFLNRRIN